MTEICHQRSNWLGPKFLHFFDFLREKYWARNIEFNLLFSNSRNLWNQILNVSEVTDDQKISDGGGLEEENEMIEVVEMSIDEFRKYLNQEELQTDGAKLHGMYWFLANKARYLENS